MVSLDSIGSLASSILVLSSLDDIELTRFILLEDTISSIRTLCTQTVHPTLRHVSVLGFGILLLRIWCKFNNDDNNSINTTSNTTIDSIIRYESYNDAKRSRESLCDLVLDIIKDFSLVLMKGSTDSNTNAAGINNDQRLKHSVFSMDAYCEVLAEVIDRYNQGTITITTTTTASNSTTTSTTTTTNYY